MPLRDAILELRDRLMTLRVRLKALIALTQQAGGGSVHSLIEQVDKAAVDAQGWARAASRAVRRAAEPGARSEAIRLALTDAQHALDQLRRKEPRRLRGRGLATDLDDLCGRHEQARDAGLKRLGLWAKDTKPSVRAVCAAHRAVEAAMATCWRELASGLAGRVKVKTVTVVE
jgi:hypothetical protein